MSSSNSTSITEEIEDFLYTPYGLATLAIVAVTLTSLIWLLGCWVYCCYRKRRRQRQAGTTEANRDLYYLGVNDQNGTLTSGYNTGPQSYSLSLTTDNRLFHTSLDSILDAES